MFLSSLYRYKSFLPTWSCGTRQRDTTSSGLNFKLYNFNPYHAKMMHLIFQPHELVDRGSDAQPQVVENDSYLFNLWRNIYKI